MNDENFPLFLKYMQEGTINCESTWLSTMGIKIWSCKNIIIATVAIAFRDNRVFTSICGQVKI